MPKLTSLRAPAPLAVLRALADGQEHSTMDLIRRSGRCAVDTYVRTIRSAGWDVPRRIAGGVHYYSLSTPDLERLIALEGDIAADRHTTTQAALAARRSGLTRETRA